MGRSSLHLFFTKVKLVSSSPIAKVEARFTFTKVAHPEILALPNGEMGLFPHMASDFF
jgi:hypothetical protein